MSLFDTRPPQTRFGPRWAMIFKEYFNIVRMHLFTFLASKKKKKIDNKQLTNTYLEIVQHRSP